MMRKINYFFIVFVSLMFTLSCSEELKQGETAFMENARVFEGFDMKKDYDKRMEEDMSFETKLLDSLELQLAQVIQAGDSLKAYQLRKQHYVVEQQYAKKFQENSTRYTQEVNDRLNKYIEQYAEDNGYDFILGSNGQGNVMYAKKNKNITDDLIKYINTEFNAK